MLLFLDMRHHQQYPRKIYTNKINNNEYETTGEDEQVC